MNHHQAQNKFVTDSFLKNTADHQLTVILDQGVHRHLRFAKPDTGNMAFSFITWPGSLCYTGDMGTFVFSRLHDMFEFFRCERADRMFEIDHRYWAEKCQAGDKSDGIEHFSMEMFREQVADYSKQYAEGNDLGPTRTAEFLQRVKDELHDNHFESDVEAYQATNDFEFGKRSPFQDFWEVRCSDYSYRFRWCCRALRWGIAQYDMLTNRPVTVAANG